MRQVILLLLFPFTFFSQTPEELKAYRLDSLNKHHLIFASTFDEYTITHSPRNGRRMRSATARSTVIEFRVGAEGTLKTIGSNGRSLFEALQNDPEAYAELTRAYKVHLKKRRLSKTLEILGYGVFVASAVPLIIGLDNFDTRGITDLAMLGGVGVTLGITDFIVCHKRTEKHLDAFAISVQRAIQIYNLNLLHKVR